jgi:hypothetical protein
LLKFLKLASDKGNDLDPDSDPCQMFRTHNTGHHGRAEAHRGAMEAHQEELTTAAMVIDIDFLSQIMLSQKIQSPLP